MIAPTKSGELRIAMATASIAGFCLACMAAALPWELFQRIPFAPFTTVRLTSLLLIGTGAVLFVIDWRNLRVARTGIEAPLFFLAMVCSASLIWSVDPSSTSEFLLTYAGYAALTFIVGVQLANRDAVHQLARVYIFSAFGVAAFTLACWTEWLYPTYWRPTLFLWAGRLIEVFRQGTEMRFVAASNDLNQGPLYLLVAFALSLYLFEGGKRSVYATVGLRVGQMLLLVAILLAQSRSALIAAALLCVIYLFIRANRFLPKRCLIGGFTAGLVVIAILGWHTFGEWFVRHDGAVTARLVAFEAGLELLPRYWAHGTGLGASDSAIATLGAGPHVGGQTIHNVPFKFLLETGVLGFAGFVWLLWRCASRLFGVCRRDMATQESRAAAGLLSAGFAVVFMGLFQPFMMLPVYPFLLGLTVAIIRPSRMPYAHASFPARLGAPPKLAWWAFAIVTTIAVGNAALFQYGSLRSEVYGDVLAAAAQAERHGEWEEAEAGYRKALTIANPMCSEEQHTLADAPFGRLALGRIPFAAELAVLFDYPRIHDLMNLGREQLDPRSAALAGLGRVLIAQGDSPQARRVFTEAAKHQPDFAAVVSYQAEADWSARMYEESVAGYREAAMLAELPVNWRFQSYRARLEARIQALDDNRSPGALLEQAYLLRRLGDWQGAVARYEQVATERPDYADAHFNLGVNALIHGRPDESKRLLGRACRAAPTHYSACETLEAVKSRLSQTRWTRQVSEESSS